MKVGVRTRWLRLPEATARAHDHHQEAKHEIDRDDASDLIQVLGGFSECLPCDGMAETANSTSLCLIRG
jgi:hypothetical protein